MSNATQLEGAFEGRVALVTGAASGIGLAGMRAFAAAGAAVVLADVDETAAQSAAEELEAAGHRALGMRCYVADEAQVASLVERTLPAYGA